MAWQEVELSFNGTTPDGAQPVRVWPGQLNTLRVTWRPRSGDSPCVATLVITAPDGRQQSASQPCRAGEPLTFDPGLFAVPARYEFTAGVIIRHGYALHLALTADDGTRLAHSAWYQSLTRDRDAETLCPGEARGVVYNDGYIPAAAANLPPGIAAPSHGLGWYPFTFSGRPMDPPVELCLAPGVLVNPDWTRARFRLRENSPELAELAAWLTVRDAAQHIIYQTRVTVTAAWQEHALPLADVPPGEYRIELQLLAGDTAYDGPAVTYRRGTTKPDAVFLSPLAPFHLQRDPTRATVVMNDWQHIVARGWMVSGAGDRRALVETGDPAAEEIRLAAALTGPVAVFARVQEHAFLQKASDGLVRPISPYQQDELGPTFVTTADLTDDVLTLLPCGLAGAGLVELHLIPVTAESVADWQQQMERPPLALRAVADWSCASDLGASAWLRATGRGYRAFITAPQGKLEREYIDGVLSIGLGELGITSADWAIGRSWVEYHSQLPGVAIYPCVELTPELLAKYPHFEEWRRLTRDVDALRHALDGRPRHGVRLLAWLGMNRHYSPDSYGGVFTSPWMRAHPEWNQIRKDGTRDSSRVEYYFPEVREERLAILAEAATYGPDGIVVGLCRQPPMAAYHPAMVAAYQQETGVDPRTLDMSQPAAFTDWLRWRAAGLTQLLRDLRQRLATVEETAGRRLPVTVRIPAGGLFWNLANGMDVETWAREGLVDEIQVDPLEDHSQQGSQDIGPYLALGRAHGIPVFGGVNLTGAFGFHERFNPAVGIRRALGLAAAGVDGIEVYEAESFYLATHARWLAALWGHPDLARQFLAESNVEAVYPITATNAALGHDNHWLYAPSLHGVPGAPLPRGMASWL